MCECVCVFVHSFNIKHFTVVYVYYSSRLTEYVLHNAF